MFDPMNKLQVNKKKGWERNEFHSVFFKDGEKSNKPSEI